MSRVLTVTSPAFSPGGTIPGKYTCLGEDVSPPIEWSELPREAKSVALICEDPDAPGGTWVHWVIFNLPPTAEGLDENISRKPDLKSGGKQGVNDFGRQGYGGPCPPPGPEHRYLFRVYALDAVLELGAYARKKDLIEAMKGGILAQGELVGKFGR